MAEVFMSTAGVGNGFEDKTQYQIFQFTGDNSNYLVFSGIFWSYVLIEVVFGSSYMPRPFILANPNSSATQEFVLVYVASPTSHLSQNIYITSTASSLTVVNATSGRRFTVYVPVT